jgi:hypothetical protein
MKRTGWNVLMSGNFAGGDVQKKLQEFNMGPAG